MLKKILQIQNNDVLLKYIYFVNTIFRLYIQDNISVINPLNMTMTLQAACKPAPW